MVVGSLLWVVAARLRGNGIDARGMVPLPVSIAG